MNNKLRYLVFALFVSLHLNASDGGMMAAIYEAPSAVSAAVLSSAETVSTMVGSGADKVVLWVRVNPKLTIAGASLATVVAVYAAIKLKKSAEKVYNLEAELEEIKALAA